MEHGPIYDVDSATLKKFRARTKDGLKSIDFEEIREYAEAVEKAVLAKQRAQLRRAAVPERRPPCASGTWHTTGEAIEEAIRAQHRADLLAYPAKVRRERHPTEWQHLYDKAMAEKRARQSEAA